VTGPDPKELPGPPEPAVMQWRPVPVLDRCVDAGMAVRS
jgi:hypothetical protein